MITYQVDQCARWKTFVESCRKQALVDVWHFPSKLENEEDPRILEYVLPSGRTLLTTDRTIHYDNPEHIPDRHSGILIVASASPMRTMTMRHAMRTLARLKSDFPEWHSASLRNSIVEITEAGAQVWKVDQGSLAPVAFMSFDQPGWQANLAQLLKQRSAMDLMSDDM
jgi:hypothetical protein